MWFTLTLTPFMRQQLYRRLHQAYASGALRLVKRIHTLLAMADGMTVCEVAQMLNIGEQTIRDYRNRFLWQGVASLVYQRPPGRPSKLTKTQRQELSALIAAGPQAAGYPSGCWSATIIQDRIHRHFGVEYHPHYICTLLDNLGFSYQKARFVSAHLDEATRLAWRQTTWPKVLRKARQRKALLLFGDEASFAQWGSLSYTWAPKGHPTRGADQWHTQSVQGLWTHRLFFGTLVLQSPYGAVQLGKLCRLFVRCPGPNYSTCLCDSRWSTLPHQQSHDAVFRRACRALDDSPIARVLSRLQSD